MEMDVMSKCDASVALERVRQRRCYPYHFEKEVFLSWSRRFLHLLVTLSIISKDSHIRTIPTKKSADTVMVA
jgi:hypothetical protein